MAMLEVQPESSDGWFAHEDARLPVQEGEYCALFLVSGVIAANLYRVRDTFRQLVGFVVRVTPDDPRLARGIDLFRDSGGTIAGRQSHLAMDACCVQFGDAEQMFSRVFE